MFPKISRQDGVWDVRLSDKHLAFFFVAFVFVWWLVKDWLPLIAVLSGLAFYGRYFGNRVPISDPEQNDGFEEFQPLNDGLNQFDPDDISGWGEEKQITSLTS